MLLQINVLFAVALESRSIPSEMDVQAHVLQMNSQMPHQIAASLVQQES